MCSEVVQLRIQTTCICRNPDLALTDSESKKLFPR